MAEPIDITRRQAVRGQLETAIELHFFGGDAVSAHVLASAASEVLRGLAKHKGLESFDARGEKVVRPEKIKFWHDAMNRHYNFFKHADRDATTDVISFNPEITIFEIFGGIEDYGLLFGKLTIPMTIFRGYMVKTNPDLFLKEYLDKVEVGLRMFDEGGRSPHDASAGYLKLYNEGALRGNKMPEHIEV